MRKYKEKTEDHGYPSTCCASDNNAEYILTSAHAHDAYREYVNKYNRLPTSRWYNRYFQFERIS